MTEALYIKDNVITENSDKAKELHKTGAFGTALDDGRIQLSLLEGLYLLETKKITIYDGKNKKLNKEEYTRKAKRKDKKFTIRYPVFKDLRKRGYIVKTALKFGADFRVYDRGIKPGEEHAKWIVYPVHETHSQTWHDFAAKNRVAHSTKKKLLIGVTDDEGDVSYWEVRWLRP